MGESASARTERELAALRGEIDADLTQLRSRLSEDADPRRLARRQPLAVVGALGSLAAVTGLAIASRIREMRRARTEKELDQVIQRLGGRLDRLKGKARKRLRESLRKEIGEVESGPRAQRMIWESATAALTAAATLLARRFASRLAADEKLAEGQR
jgi:type VI protein secretion system component VasF